MSSPAVSARTCLAKGAALLGCSLAAASHANAAIVNVDLTNVGIGGQDISGVNAGKTFGSPKTTVLDIFGTSDLDIYFDSGKIGFDGDNGLRIASTGTYGGLLSFAGGATIDAASSFTGEVTYSVFALTPSVGPHHIVPDFGPNRFIGFRFGSDAAGWNYGYFEVLWTWTGTSSTSSFQLLSAAYESALNTAIVTPAGGGGGGGVPLPGAAGLAACGLLAASRRRRR